jgi:hypothetical protein
LIAGITDKFNGNVQRSGSLADLLTHAVHFINGFAHVFRIAFALRSACESFVNSVGDFVGVIGNPYDGSLSEKNKGKINGNQNKRSQQTLSW